MDDRPGIERAVVGALRAAIRDHGPITPEHIGSAAKRIVGNLKNARCPGCGQAPTASQDAGDLLARLERVAVVGGKP